MRLAEHTVICKMLAVVVQDIVAAFPDPLPRYGNDLLRGAHLLARASVRHHDFQIATLQKGEHVCAENTDLPGRLQGVIWQTELDHLGLRNKYAVMMVKLHLCAYHIPEYRGLFRPAYT